MTIHRRHVILSGALALGTGALTSGASFAMETADGAALAEAVESLRKAMLDADKAKLEALVSDHLSYGHSSGKLQDKADFIDVIVKKATIYKSISLTDHKNAVAGNNGIARHIWTSESESDGKVSSAHIGVLQVWVKDSGWKLLARQAFKI
jgi:hypothetical protein